MKKKSASHSAFFNPRVLLGVLICLAGVSLALVASGIFSAQAQPRGRLAGRYMNLIDPLVPPGFDCSKIYELGIDKQENLRAGALMIYCGLAEGGSWTSNRYVSWLMQQMLPA